MNTQKTKNRKIKVLVVEDSPTVGLYLEYLLESDPEIEVIGNVKNGKLAVEFVEKKKPDIITMDIDMPVMNGYDATRAIMSTNPVPIIIVTASRNAKKQSTSMEALAAGALTVIQKPEDIKAGIETEQNRKMVSMIKIYSQVRVVRRRHIEKLSKISRRKPCECKVCNIALCRFEDRKYVAIGISTGGPEVLKTLFSNISANFPLPIVVVQHITEGFLESMVAWLNSSSQAKIKVARHGEVLLPGHIYFAPNKYQMGINYNKVDLKRPNSKIKICPSVEYLFSSLLAEKGRHTIAMLLTGMGSDGAKELKSLKDAGALTIAQDEESSLVYGMPEKAVQMDGANYVLNPGQIIQIFKDIESKFIKNK